MHHSPNPETRYLFIDGGYLRQVLNNLSTRYFNGDAVDLNFEQVAGIHRKTFYYDCLPPNQKNESPADHESATNKQQAFFNKLKRLSGFHVYEGAIRGEGNRKRQKMIDTLMAVDMMTHSYRQNATEITLLAGDLDFQPIVDALVRNGTYVRLWYEKESTSKELLDAADAREELDIIKVFGWVSIEFRRAHSIPAATIGNKHATSGYALIKKGVLPDGRSTELLKRDKESAFCVAFPDKLSDAWVVVKHDKEELLKKFVDDIFAPITWLSEASAALH